MNAGLETVIVAPMTTKGRPYPSRVACRFQGKHGMIAFDQIRVVDVSRLNKRLGKISEIALGKVLSVLVEIFSPNE